eukprot:gene7392-11714_t
MHQLILLFLILPNFIYSDLIPLPYCPKDIPCGVYDPNLPHIPCSLLPKKFINCFFQPGSCKSHELGTFTLAPLGNLNCTSLEGVDCIGENNFLVKNVPCQSQSSKKYMTAMLYSILLGIFGADRYYLEHYILGIAKMFTLGGLGVWWIVDLVLLSIGSLRPADGGEWATTF